MKKSKMACVALFVVILTITTKAQERTIKTEMGSFTLSTDSIETCWGGTKVQFDHLFITSTGKELEVYNSSCIGCGNVIKKIFTKDEVLYVITDSQIYQFIFFKGEWRKI